jgi:hypothetical protein
MKMAEIFNKKVAKKFSYVNLFVYIYTVIKNQIQWQHAAESQS